MHGTVSTAARYSALSRVPGVVDVRILGPLEVIDDDGTPIPVPGLRPKALLAYLVLRTPHGSSSDRILEDVWYDDPPSSMDTTLQVTVSRLRKAIGSEYVVTTSDGYQLDIPDANTDLDRFRLHAKRGRQLATLGQHGPAAEAFRQGLAEWRGPALGDLRQIEFAERTSSQLEEERLAVVEDLISSTISAGDHRLVVGELGGLVEAFPYRERLWELFMLALYRSGRQADALDAFTRAKTALGDNLGIEPSQQLVDLEERILLHDSALALTHVEAQPMSGERTVLDFPPGAVIVDEGEPADTVYWIEEGTVKVSVATPDGSMMEVAELGPGRYFGELAALLGSRRTATVTALTPAKLTVHDTASFRARLGAERSRATLDESVRKVEDLVDSGQYLAAYDHARALIDVGEASPRLRWLAVLALARSGATTHARKQYDSLKLAELDPESMPASLAADIAVLAARLDKDLALKSSGEQRTGWAERSAMGYERAFNRSSEPYHGVNAATMSLLAGDTAAAKKFAERSLVEFEALVTKDYWAHVSEAEAAILIGDMDRAARAIAAGAATGEHTPAARASTLGQLRRILSILGRDDTLLSPLTNPTVVHYCGHVIQPEGNAGRFPADEAAAVAEHLAKAYADLGVGSGFGSLAAGADILAAEALLDRNADLHVVLPFPADEFLETSVNPAGGDWPDRFERCLDEAVSVTVVTASGAIEDPVLYDYCARVAMGDALIHARHLQAEAHQVAVWDGTPSTGVAGTGVDVQHWRGTGRASTIISVTAGPGQTTPPTSARERRIRSVLFADFAGFSRLTDRQVDRFQREVMATVSAVLAGYRDHILSSRTWGDGIYLVLDDVAAAARCALDLRDVAGRLDFSDMGLPELRGLRVAAHATPVFEGWDPISKSPVFYGAGVTETARVEPRTPEGEIYTTHAFAALAVLGGADDFDCQYVGTIPTAKDFGEMALYSLRRRA